MMHSARRLQIIPPPFVRDHVPVATDFYASLRSDNRPLPAPRWDRDALALAVQTGLKAKEFEVELDAELRSKQLQCETALKLNCTDVFWETLENLKAAGASSLLVLPVEKMLA